MIEVPERELTTGDLEAGEAFRVGVLPQAMSPSTAESKPSPGRERGGPEPPVDEGDVVDVEIEDIGDQGDGIARVGPGYVIIVPETELTERVAVEVTGVLENMAFAEVVDRHDELR